MCGGIDSNPHTYLVSLRRLRSEGLANLLHRPNSESSKALEAALFLDERRLKARGRCGSAPWCWQRRQKEPAQKLTYTRPPPRIPSRGGVIVFFALATDVHV